MSLEPSIASYIQANINYIYVLNVFFQSCSAFYAATQYNAHYIVYVNIFGLVYR